MRTYSLRAALAVLFLFPIRLFSQGYDSLMWVPNGPVNAIVKSGNDIYFGGDFDYMGKPTGFAVPLDINTALPYFQNFPKVDGPVYAIASDFKGGWYIGGSFNYVGNIPRKNFARIKSDGTVMPINIAPDGPVYAIETSSGGLGSPWVFIGGAFHNCDGQPVYNICQLYTMQQHIHPLWIPNLNGPVYSIKKVGDQVWVGGSFTNVNGFQGTGYLTILSVLRNFDPTLYSLTNPSGSIFANPNPPNGTVYALYYNYLNGKLFAGGAFSYLGPLFRNHAGSIVPSTYAITNWNPNITGTVRAISGLLPGPTPQTDHGNGGNRMMSTAVANTIYLGGQFTFINSIPAKGFAEMDANAPNVLSTSTNNANCNGSIWSIYADKTRNRIYVGGQFTSIGGAQRYNFACMDTNGIALNLVASVGNKVRALCVTGSLVYLGSESPCMYGNPSGPIASINTSTGNVNAWSAPVKGTVNCMGLSPGNILYIGGAFDSIQGIARKNLGAIDLGTQSVTAFNPGCTGTVRTLLLCNNKLYVGGYFTYTGGQQRNNLACIDIPSAQATIWSPDADGTVNTLVLNNGKIYCGGYFSNIGGSTHEKIACLDTVGGYAINAWNPSPDDGVYALAVTGNTITAGGWFNNVNAQGRNNICSLDLGGGSITSFDPSPDDYVRALGVSGNYVFAGGNFTMFAGQPRHSLAAYDHTNGQLQALDISLSASPLVFYLDGTELYVGGLFTGIQRDVHAYFVKIDTWYLLGENEDDFTGGDLAIYPNPNTGHFSIEGNFKNTSWLDLGIYNALGQKVMEEKMSADAGSFHHDFDISGMSAGIYYVNIFDGKTRRSLKIVKQ
ncbi:MAG TPA: T9SS type A sorting domain-containing protein [Bacteroidia bacterium]|jgi:hypothetical protein